ncbi:TolC family protein [Alphaproteobacteria bacterium]|nr:TolC family protein [Alphaproteobacteria bacterium]
MQLSKSGLLCLSLLTVLCGNARAETVYSAVQTALQTHPSVESAAAAVEVARQKRREEFSAYFPEISVGAKGGRVFGDNATSRGSRTTRGEAYSYLWEGNASLRQPLFDGFETRKRVDSANASKLSARQTLIETQENLVFNTVRSYVDLLRSRKALVLIELQAAKVADYLDRIEQGVDEGVMDEAELQQAKDVKASTEGVLAQYRGQAAAAEAEYIELVGALPKDDLDNPQPNVEMMLENINEALAYAVDNHPSVLAGKLNVKAAKYDVGAEFSSLYPSFDSELSYLKTDKKEEIGGEVTDGRAVVRMNWGFETGLGQFARIEQKKSSLREAQAQLDEVRKQIERGVRLSYAEYQTAIDLLNNHTKRVELSGDLYETYEIQFEAAVVSILDLMQTDSQYFLARLDQLNTAHRALLAQYAILASFGRLKDSFAQDVAQAGTNGE